MDVHGGSESLNDPGANLLDAIQNFRNDGPKNNLKYGAAYAPNLETILDYAYDEAQVMVTEILNGTASPAAALGTLTSNQSIERARAAIGALPLKLPPSAAIAGIYAQVDADRGVWKAPANVGMNAVIKPTIEYTNTANDQLNVDPTAGKSINAIRPFVGKGTLVWGARTLAGNDNEWRYVNVRRFFIFVEESTKKATEQFTFEPNDANTWVKVQAMIENFLTTQWRAGALQGIKPEHAFYVAVGLGKTMTPLDILEGRMIVEIGMAVVRPAEFIILRFSHKLAES
jgi:phage tail sheath protein FI